MKKTLKKRSFVSAIAMLVVSAIVLTSSTFAWFSMGKEASVGTFDLEVSSPEGIQISANATRFTSTITYADLTGENTTAPAANAYAGNQNVMSTMLLPVTGNAVTAGKLALFKAQISENSSFPSGYGITGAGPAYNTAAATKDAEYMAFDIFFRVSVATTLTMKGTSIVDGNADGLNGSDATTALRVGMIRQNFYSEAKTLTPAQAATMSGTAITIYEPNALNHTESGIAAGYTNGTKAVTHPWTNSPGSSYNVTGVTPSGGGIGPNPYNATQTTVIDPELVTINLQPGVTKYRVYLWLEGQDGDCGNAVAGGNLTVKLNFSM